MDVCSWFLAGSIDGAVQVALLHSAGEDATDRHSPSPVGYGLMGLTLGRAGYTAGPRLLALGYEQKEAGNSGVRGSRSSALETRGLAPRCGNCLGAEVNHIWVRYRAVRGYVGSARRHEVASL